MSILSSHKNVFSAVADPIYVNDFNNLLSCYPNITDQGVSIFTYLTNCQPQTLVSAEVLQSVTCYVLVAQLCLTLCDPMVCSPPASSIDGIFLARILELVAIPFSRGSSRPRDQTQVSCNVDEFLTIWATREVPDNVLSSTYNKNSYNTEYSPNTPVFGSLKYPTGPSGSFYSRLLLSLHQKRIFFNF